MSAAADLRRIIIAASLGEADEAAAAAPELGARFDAERATVDFDPPVDAALVLEATGWTDAFAVSPVVHQTRWKLVLRTGAYETPHGYHGVVAEDPTAGERSLRVWLDGRPGGPLPDAVWGPSPAYDLPRYPARVARVELGPLDV